MKQQKKAQTISMIALFISLAILSYIAYQYEHNYKRVAKVTDITGNVITLTDECNFNWQMETTDKLNIDDKVILSMNDNNTTNNIFDDIITDYTKVETA